MSTMASQVTGVSIVCSTVCSGADQRKPQSSASLAFVREIHRCPVDSSQKGPVTRKMLPFDIMLLQPNPKPASACIIKAGWSICAYTWALSNGHRQTETWLGCYIPRIHSPCFTVKCSYPLRKDTMSIVGPMQWTVLAGKESVGYLSLWEFNHFPTTNTIWYSKYIDPLIVIVDQLKHFASPFVNFVRQSYWITELELK